ncbi:MAG: oligosaccharide flippase family protein [Candidatus Micrarchaeia archaeon]
MKDKDLNALDLGSRTAKVAGALFVGKLFSFVVLAITFIAVVRILAPANYGIYTLVVAFVGIFSSVGNFGVATITNKLLAENNKNKAGKIILNATVLILILGTVTMAMAIAFGILGYKTLQEEGISLWLLLGASSTIILSMLFGVLYSSLVGLNRGRALIYLLLIQGVAQAIVSIGLALLDFGALAPVIGNIAGFAIAIAYAAVYLFSNIEIGKSTTDAKMIKMIFKSAYPIGLSNIFSTITSNLAIMLLAFFVPVTIIGNIGTATKMGALVDIVAGSIGGALLSMFSYTASTKSLRKKLNVIYNFSLNYGTLSILPLLMYIFIFAKPLSYIAFSSTYSKAPEYIMLISLGMMISLFGGYASSVMVGAGKMRQVLKYNIAIAAVQLLAIPLFIPIFKGIGAIFVLYFLGPLAAGMLYVIGARSQLHIKISFKKLARIVCANILTGIASLPLIFIIKYYPLLITAAFAEWLLVYPIALALLNGIDKNDFDIIGKVIDSTLKYGAIEKLYGFLVYYMSIFISFKEVVLKRLER